MKADRVLRAATRADCNACHKLASARELATPWGDAPPLEWFKAIVREKQILIVAEEDGEIVGFRMGERIAGNWAIAHLMIVREDMRDKGVGTALVKAFEKECRRRKMGGIMTYVFAGNKKTVQFFEKHKYKRGSPVLEFVKVLRR